MIQKLYWLSVLVTAWLSVLTALRISAYLFVGFFGLGSFLLGEVGVFMDSYIVAAAVVVAAAVAGGCFLKLEPWNFSSLFLPLLAFSVFL